MMQSNIADKIKAYLTPNFPEYLNLLHKMVSINSFTENINGINDLAMLTANAFAKLGFQSKQQPSINQKFGQHLILTKPGRSNRKIGFISHLDTVFPPEEEIAHHFAWRHEGDRIYGPGTVDIKGGTLIIYMMLAAIKAVSPTIFDDITWVVLLNAAEERLVMGFEQVCLQYLTGETLACLVFEGGQYRNDVANIVVSRKGMAHYLVEARGRAAHSGSAHPKGANAIVQIAHTIQKIAALTDYDKHLTFNVGTVSGGTVTNRVPHYARAKIEMRAFSDEVFKYGLTQMLNLSGVSSVYSAEGKYPCQVNVTVLDQKSPWSPNSKSDYLFDIWQKTAQSIGVTVNREHRGGLSDGNLTWNTWPTIDGLGPDGGNAHCSERSLDGKKDQEYAVTSSFIPKTVLNTMAVLNLIKNSG